MMILKLLLISLKNWNFQVCGRASLCGQMKKGSLRTLEKPDSVIEGPSYIYQKTNALENTANQVTPQNFTGTHIGSLRSCPGLTY